MSTPSQNQRFVALDSRTGWALAHTAGLEPGSGGALELGRLPGTSAAAAIDQVGPYARDLDGFAVSSCGEVSFALPTERKIALVDTPCADRRFILAESDCDGEMVLQQISGLAVVVGRLYAVDKHAGRIYVLALPGLELIDSWVGNFGTPTRVAGDDARRIYLLDTKLTRLLRLHSDGRPDASYDTGVVPCLARGLDLFVAADGRALVSVEGVADILRFASSGTNLAALAPPAEEPGLRPGALAGDGKRLYVADRASGALWVYDLEGDRWLGSLPRFRAPAAGLATDGHRHLYVRTGADTNYLRLDAQSAHASRGLLQAGPFDAGEASAWLRVHVAADVPEGTRVRLETALSTEASPASALSWRRSPSLDALVRAPEPVDTLPDAAARFIWIRVYVETDDPHRSPRLHQIVAETPGEDYLAKLPAVYARKDAEGGGFLRTLLESFRAELGDRELEVAALAQRIDPATAPKDHLEWLASWVAFDLPPGTDVSDRRALLLDAHRLYGRRGTVQGLREMVRIYAGIDCEIVESFRARHLWALDGPARLGFDTGLLPALPDGMVVPGPSLPDPPLQGLRAEYFLDDHLGRSAATPDRGGDRCEPRSVDPPLIDPNGRFPSFKVPGPPAGTTLDAFSVLWTGQVRARTSELYSFYFAHDGGARLYVDNQSLIDDWITPGNREPRGSLPLTAERWYAVRIEYWSNKGTAPKLSWSSRSQPKEIVPQECLYALSDDNINPEAHRIDGGPEPMVVGETVVGAHGPLAAEDFGAPLFDDTAHQFTVRVNAARVRAPGKLHAIRAVLDAEKPAHTDYHLCVVEPTFLVGVQARLGIDAFVAPVPPAGRYDEGELGIDSRLGISPEHDDGTLRVGETLRIGSDAILR